jgi:hypothetical protein
MPTGYTADIAKGIDFRTYAMGCAQAFGACISLRDDPNSTIPEQFEPDSYHQEALERAEESLKEAEAMTLEEAAAKASEAYCRDLESWSDASRKDRQLQEKYEEMLIEVEKWEPPTPDHVELKKFMASQIRESMDFDCGFSRTAPTLKNPLEFKTVAIESAKRDMAYHRKEHAEEIKRTNGRNAWIKALRDSLQA